MEEILPGCRLMVYDPYRNGQRGKGEFCSATVVCRYGFVSEFMEKEYGREAAKYPDCVDVIFDHDGRLSKGHFTSYTKSVDQEV